MKTTAKALVGWIATAIILTTTIATAGSVCCTSQVWLGPAVLGQAASNNTADVGNIQQSDDLLHRARQAMAENDLTAAESLISQAEALNVQYSPLHLGDTPKKARRDFDRKRNSAAGPTRPSQMFSPLGLNKNSPKKDPFAGHNPTPSTLSSAGKMIPLPKVEGASPIRSLSAQGDSPMHSAVTPSVRPSEPGQNEIRLPGKAESASPLRAARLALAVGDVRRAAELTQQARAAKANYQPLDDTPDKVQAAIEKYQEMLTLDKNTETYRRAYARNMTEQADALLRWGEYDEAERLAGRAAGMQISYGPFEQKPQDLLQKIFGQRRQNRQESRMPTAATSAPGYADAASASVAGRQQAVELVRQAREAIAAGQLDRAESLARQAEQLHMPDSAFAPGEDRPGLVLMDLQLLRQRNSSAVIPAGGNVSADRTAMPAVYDPATDQTRNMAASSQQPATAAGAMQTQYNAEQQNGQSPTLANEALARQQVLARQVAAELAHKESNARAMRESDPKGALALLEQARKQVETSALDSSIRDQLLRRVDRAIAEVNQHIEQNRPQIELTEKNKRIHDEVDRERRLKVEVGEKLATMIDDFNRLMDEQRYEEAQVVASRAAELDPNNPVVSQILWQAKFVRRYMNNKSITDAKEEGFIATLGNVDESSIPFDDNVPMVFPDGKDWSRLSARRQKLMAERGRQRTEREIEIEKKLRTSVSLQFTDAPLSKVLENLAKMAEVNLHLDPQGLAEEGVTTDTPVTIELRNEIMLKSALNLILEPLHLSYVIKDEVLKITSEQMRDGQVYRVTYNVADLVVPIPNFVPGEMGIQSALNNSLGHMGFGGGVPFGSSQSTPMAVVASRDSKGSSAMLNSDMLAQISPPQGGAGQRSGLAGAGPGGLGGGAAADFDSLIELITSTVKPTTWDEVGGPGSIAPFETNLSIVVSQTQDVHEEITDLLDQLRRLQDLQVTIEVRFITLTDDFFERIGVDFDFNLNSNAIGKGLGVQGLGGQSTTQYFQVGSNRTATVGLQAPGVFSANLDVPFTQNSYGLAVPTTSAFDAAAGASLGFAILSDIEAYFFINAAQGNDRSNVLQAPKVTLFNGQQAYVSDVSQSPFVMSVIPVVGDFAAAQQPVIVILSEGTFMTVQAVVSNDKRFVRLTVVPFFSRIGDVNTFQFTGSSTTTTDTTREGLQSAATDPSKLWNKKTDDETTTTAGTTVQLPTFSYFTVTTTVSVPDGGTVLLGGIKRLSEHRTERGVPMLNKLPYINRIFSNTAIDRETESLMMMVTPRIIIPEEEEEKIGVLPDQQ